MRPLRSLWGTGRAGLVGLSYVIDTGSGGSLRDYLYVSPHLPIPKSKQTTIQHFIGSEALQFVLGARQRVVQARHPSAVFYRLRKKPSSETARAALSAFMAVHAVIQGCPRNTPVFRGLPGGRAICDRLQRQINVRIFGHFSLIDICIKFEIHREQMHRAR